jgi:predicted amidohydrolase
MTNSPTVRVAAAQFHVGADVDANLATCLRMLDAAAACQPDLIVLPEFCNHLSWYDDKQHCFAVSVALDGPFLAAIAAKAAALNCFVAVNCTVQRDDGSATGSSLLYSRDGKLLADNTKQIYIGHENDYLERATREGPVVDTAIGRLGLYACMDGVINETPRCLALNGAQLMLNSLNSFATDEASLHIPVRAAENKVFVIAANKIGPLVPEEMVPAISAATGIPPTFLDGAGESQVVAPDGTVLAKASPDQEEFIYADIQVDLADDKRRPDGTDIFAARRPQLYAPICEDPAGQALPEMAGAAQMTAAIVQLAQASDLAEIAASLDEAVDAGAELVVLPPVSGSGDDLQSRAAFGQAVLDVIARHCGAATVVTSLLRSADNGGYQHVAVAVDATGVALAQPQVHRSARFDFSEPVDGFVTLDRSFGRLAVLTSDDSIYPETFRLLAMHGVEVVALPLAPLEAWELHTGLLERSAENRINLVVAPDSAALGPAFSTCLQTDFTVMTEWHERSFDGLLSQPELTQCAAQPGVYPCRLRPANAANKVVSHRTDLLSDRPWQIAGAITRA